MATPVEILDAQYMPQIEAIQQSIRMMESAQYPAQVIHKEESPPTVDGETSGETGGTSEIVGIWLHGRSQGGARYDRGDIGPGVPYSPCGVTAFSDSNQASDWSIQA